MVLYFDYLSLFSYCPDHRWRRSKYNPKKKSIFALPEQTEEDQAAGDGDDNNVDNLKERSHTSCEEVKGVDKMINQCKNELKNRPKTEKSKPSVTHCRSADGLVSQGFVSPFPSIRNDMKSTSGGWKTRKSTGNLKSTVKMATETGRESSLSMRDLEVDDGEIGESKSREDTPSRGGISSEAGEDNFDVEDDDFDDEDEEEDDGVDDGSDDDMYKDDECDDQFDEDAESKGLEKSAEKDVKVNNSKDGDAENSDKTKAEVGVNKEMAAEIEIEKKNISVVKKFIASNEQNNESKNIKDKAGKDIENLKLNNYNQNSNIDNQKKQSKSQPKATSRDMEDGNGEAASKLETDVDEMQISPSKTSIDESSSDQNSSTPGLFY